MFTRHCYWVLRVAYTLWCGDGGLELLTYWSASRGAHDWLTNCLAGPTHTVKGTLVRLSVIFWKNHTTINDVHCSRHEIVIPDVRRELQIETRWTLIFLFKPHSHCSLYYVTVISPPSPQNPAIASCLETLESSSYSKRIGNLLYAPSYPHDRIVSCINFNLPTCLSNKSPSAGGHQFKEIYNITTLVSYLQC